MPELRLSMATAAYDHLRDLVNGRVRPEGIDLNAMELPIEEIFHRMLAHAEWDIAEFSMAKYLWMLARGSAPFCALPVFPSRAFRHSAFYVATASGVGSAGHLVGRRVGVPEWSQTAGVYARALLQHQYGVRLTDVQWVRGGVNQAGRQEQVQLTLPDGIRIQTVADRSLSDLLLAGELDAIISPREPLPFAQNDGRIRRLWPEYEVEEKAYYRESGIFPIMHVIVVRQEVLERHPWAAMNLLTAFEQSKVNCVARLSTVVNSAAPIPWLYPALLRARQSFGADPFPYGIEANRPTLEAFARFCREQGITSEEVRVDEMFPPQVSHFVRV